jgi:hypothetical protein
MRNLVRGKRTAFRRTTKRIVRLIRRTAERATRGQTRRTDTDAVSAYWSRHTYPPNWYAFPMTAAYINESITGQNELPIPRVLGICCGNGHAEVGFVRQGLWGEVDARYFGGNVLMRALGKPFFAGFDETNPTHVEAVTRMIEFERALLASGRPSHHAYFIARKRAGTT